MIIFNNAGHCFVSAPVSQDPIVWIDAQDISTYNYNIGGWNSFNSNATIKDGINIESASSFGGIEQQINDFNGVKNYQITFECTQISVDNKLVINARDINNTNNQQIAGLRFGVGVHTLNINQDGFKTILIRISDAGVNATVKNISVKEDLGGGSYGSELIS